MSNEIDFYDVENMIRDARSAIRAETLEAVRELRRDVMAELHRQDEELSDALASLNRTLQDRTAHLV